MKLWIRRRHWLILPQIETELLPKNHDQASEAEWTIQRGSCYNPVRSHCCFLRMRHCKVQNEIWAWVFRILTVHSTNIIWSFFFFFSPHGSLVAQRLKCLPPMQETWVRSLGREDSPGEGNGNPLQYTCLEKAMTEKPSRLQSMGSQRVRHDWATSPSPFTFTFTFFLF